eukprot:5505761-Pyramimonas_sp.AAC.1
MQMSYYLHAKEEIDEWVKKEAEAHCSGTLTLEKILAQKAEKDLSSRAMKKPVAAAKSGPSA